MNTSDPANINWRKSSRSGSGQGTCVEIATTWRKSSRSGSGQGACVEITLTTR